MGISAPGWGGHSVGPVSRQHGRGRYLAKHEGRLDVAHGRTQRHARRRLVPVAAGARVPLGQTLQLQQLALREGQRLVVRRVVPPCVRQPQRGHRRRRRRWVRLALTALALALRGTVAPVPHPRRLHFFGRQGFGRPIVPLDAPSRRPDAAAADRMGIFLVSRGCEQ